MNIREFLLVVVGTVVLTGTVVFTMNQTNEQFKGVSPDVAQFQASSTISVGPDVVQTLFSSKTRCASRVISTTDAGIRLSFSGNSSPTLGHVQNASTTVVYSANETGCGAVKASAVSTTTVEVSEFIW